MYYSSYINEYSAASTAVLQHALSSFTISEDVAVLMVSLLVTPTSAFPDRARVTDRDILGEALQVAAGEGYTSIVDLLLQAGADANYFPEQDEFQMTPVIGMIFENQYNEQHVCVLELLRAAGLDLRHVSNGYTAYQYAEQYGREDLLDYLRVI